jgi:hypothetical protein
MHDKIFESFLMRQHEEAQTLTGESDLVEIHPVTPQHFAAIFWCTGLVQNRAGEIVEASRFDAGIYFPLDYLRRADPFEVVTWFGPRAVFHPNISDQRVSAGRQGICIGRLYPGTPLVEIIHQIYEIVTYQKVTMREDDALNLSACAWARQNQNRFPIDRRPLKRTSLDLVVEKIGEFTEATSK